MHLPFFYPIFKKYSQSHDHLKIGKLSYFFPVFIDWVLVINVSRRTKHVTTEADSTIEAMLVTSLCQKTQISAISSEFLVPQEKGFI
jgi:hypothetical protein